MIKIKARWLTTILGMAGITFLFFVFHNGLEGPEYTEEWKKEFWNHESIHMRQQWELLFVFQWILYGIFYLRNRFKGIDHHTAYKNNPFERESYENSKNFKYLETRKMYGWIKYI